MREEFGHLPDGRRVERVTLTNGEMEASILTWGATVQDLRVAGRRVVIGGDQLEDYLGDLLYAGAIVGRFANRIGGARFELEGKTHHTDPNFRARHTLHGGQHLPDGDMGFPGAMDVTVTYQLAQMSLFVAIEARTTKATPCSFAHHGYFVLDDSGAIADHDLRIDAHHYLPVDHDLIPTGKITQVADTRFDFTTGRGIGTGGYDHNFCLSQSPSNPLRPVAHLQSNVSGLALEVLTTEPGLQLYDGAHLGGARGHDGKVLRPHAGLALETQSWPDSPNRPDFPSCILEPQSTYRTRTQYRFIAQ